MGFFRVLLRSCLRGHFPRKSEMVFSGENDFAMFGINIFHFFIFCFLYSEVKWEK